jgi:hypothetical protein
MTAVYALPADLGSKLERLAADIRTEHRCHIRELRIEVAAGGVVLAGRAATFYGKQLALAEVIRRCGLPVAANRVEVLPRPAATR